VVELLDRIVLLEGTAGLPCSLRAKKGSDDNEQYVTSHDVRIRHLFSMFSEYHYYERLSSSDGLAIFVPKLKHFLVLGMLE
jgi:hypothetical protein